MAIIGTFTRSGTEYRGDIRTLTFHAEDVRIVPTQDTSNTDLPTHRLYLGRSDLGAAWSKTSERNGAYLSIKLDDPSLPAPIYATLFADETGETFNLLWSRPRRD